jgi:hypothetical protein
MGRIRLREILTRSDKAEIEMRRMGIPTISQSSIPQLPVPRTARASSIGANAVRVASRIASGAYRAVQMANKATDKFIPARDPYTLQVIQKKKDSGK